MQTKVSKILRILHKRYPDPKIGQTHKNPLQVLIATILSAQCTDKRVSSVTKQLFKEFKTLEDYATCKLDKLEHYIKSTGYYKNKAKNIKACAQELIKLYDGRVPNTIDKLIKLPGVGRKTANVVLAKVFAKSEGIVVDTHVSRVSYRIGLTKHYKKPLKIEQDLIRQIPKKEWIYFSNSLIEHGRNVCLSRVPRCTLCCLSNICQRNSVIKYV